MATMPGFAEDFAGRRRIVEMEVTAASSILSKKGVSPPGQAAMAKPLGALKSLLDTRYRSACAEFSSCRGLIQQEASQRVRRGCCRIVE